MKYTLLLTLASALFLLCACTMFESRQVAPPAEAPHKALAVPIGKNWQIIEEPPQLSGDRLPFQTEQSVQPTGARPVTPGEKLNVETTR